MATGYTSNITDKTTLAEFTMRCARAFGALIEMRDDPVDAPIPETFEVDTYHHNALIDAKKELEKVRSYTIGQIKEQCYLHNKYVLESWQESESKKEMLKNNYERLLNFVNKWEPPTKDHINLKTFMIEQLTSSIKWDCTPSEKPIPLTPQEWHEKQIENGKWNVNYHTKGIKKSEDIAKEQTEWVKALRKSIKAL